MSTATQLFVCLACVSICAAAHKKEVPPVFACNLKAIKAEDRPRYQGLVTRVRAAIRGRTEMTNGYTFKLDSDAISLLETAEWINMERLCCPFLSLQLSAAGNQQHWLLTLTGPDRVKPLLDAEFPAR
jgi:hypothetical protein